MGWLGRFRKKGGFLKSPASVDVLKNLLKFLAPLYYTYSEKPFRM